MSPVLKTNGSHGPEYGAQITPFRLEDVSAKAQDFLDQAEAQAARILAQAREQAQQIRTQAEQQGAAAARAAAEAKFEARLRQSVAAASGVIREFSKSLQEARTEWIRQWEHEAIRLAVAIAGRILRSPLSQSPEVSLHLVREALEMTSGSSQIALHVHPGDQAVLEEHLPEFRASLPQVAKIQIIADERVSPGGCVVRTEFGTIDQTFEAQLDRIEQELTR